MDYPFGGIFKEGPKIVGYDGRFRKRCTCGECGAIVEYSKHDVQPSETSSTSFGVLCPGCISEIPVLNIQTR